MATDFIKAGGDYSFLTNPRTATYNKDSTTVEDMTAGAASALLDLDGDVEMAGDIAKMAKGQEVSQERQNQINNDPKAKQVLEQLQGELDMSDNSSALTRAVRMTTVNGALGKMAAAVTEFNPDKTILTPAQTYLAENGVMGVADARRIGGVLDKVLDGIEITRDEAKLFNFKKNPTVHAAVIDLLGLDISEYADTDTVLKELNQKAAEVAKTKDLQAGVQQATRQQAASAGRVRRTRRGVPGVKNRGGINRAETTVRNVQRGAEGLASGSRAEGSAVGQGAPGGVPAATGSGEMGAAQRSAPVPGARDVISPDQLTPELRNVQRKAAADGASSVVFFRGEDSYVKETRGASGEITGYEIGVRTDGAFSPDQYATHEARGQEGKARCGKGVQAEDREGKRSDCRKGGVPKEWQRAIRRRSRGEQGGKQWTKK